MGSVADHRPRWRYECDSEGSFTTAMEQFQKPVPVELKAGECVFHHPLAIHGSFENRTERPRRAVVINVVLDGVRSESDQPLLDGVPVVPKGSKLDGQFFPLLYHNPVGESLRGSHSSDR